MSRPLRGRAGITQLPSAVPFRLTNPVDCEVHGQGQSNQDKAQGQRQSELPLAGFKRDCRGQHTGGIIDVATDDHDCPYLSDPAAKTREGGRQQGSPCIPKQCPHLLKLRDVQRDQQVMIFRPKIPQGLMRDRCDQGHNDNHLRHDHRRWGKEQAKRAQRPRTGQENIDDQAHDHRRQPHQGVQNGDYAAPPTKPAHSQKRRQGQGDQAGDNQCRQRHAQRPQRDFGQFRIERDDQPKGVSQSLP
mmetsp:Transcript_28968/g.55491  ORF Transcript_28968/g.55491 Transcript_28968/m.55491 type:complete len:245 (-) Transcript_28968:22-756(-)